MVTGAIGEASPRLGVKIGLIHPGTMGAALARCLEGEVLWASERRSAATVARATEAGISDQGSLESLVTSADAVMAVCPPGAALEVAEQVSVFGFDGMYVDLNAVAPASARAIGGFFTRFVDGGIVGPPPASPGDTRVYLSGEDAALVARLFAGSAVDARVIGSKPGQASAVKMAYAAWTKGSSALLLSAAALATSEGVIDELLDEWDMSIPDLRERLERVSARIGGKAWRFVGEMEEIAHSYGNSGLPDAFHLAAADLYARLADLKDGPQGQSPDEVVRRLLDSISGSSG